MYDLYRLTSIANEKRDTFNEYREGKNVLRLIERARQLLHCDLPAGLSQDLCLNEPLKNLAVTAALEGLVLFEVSISKTSVMGGDSGVDRLADSGFPAGIAVKQFRFMARAAAIEDQSPENSEEFDADLQKYFPTSNKESIHRAVRRMNILEAGSDLLLLKDTHPDLIRFTIALHHLSVGKFTQAKLDAAVWEDLGIMVLNRVAVSGDAKSAIRHNLKMAGFIDRALSSRGATRSKQDQTAEFLELLRETERHNRHITSFQDSI